MRRASKHQRVSKILTVVLLATTFSFSASAMKSKRSKVTFSSVRLSLWYEGARPMRQYEDFDISKKPSHEQRLVEELDQALKVYERRSLTR